MKNELNFVPKKLKVNYKIVVPSIILALLIVGFFTNRYLTKLNLKEDLYYKICDFDAEETTKKLKSRQKEYNKQETIDLADFTYYGESLTLYQSQYEIGKIDAFSGNTIFLNNLCKTTVDDKQPYLISNDKDVGIEVMHLDDGIYEVEILSDFKFKRFITETPIDDVFMSAKRNGKIKEIRLLSDKEIFNENHESPLLKENYLFIEVRTIEDNDEVDVILNPSRLTEGDYNQIDHGHFYDDLLESEETFKMAKRVKEILEEKKVRVALSRNGTYPVNNFGEESRVQEAYEMNAKYMVNMRLESSGSLMDTGVVVLYSNVSSSRFASNMASKLIEETKLPGTPYYDGNNPQGVFQTGLESGLDYNDIIRETGGRITGAGLLDDFQALTSYGKDINRGINTIDVLYGYMSHPDDLNAWQTDFENIAQKTAEAILTQLGLQGD